MVDPQWYLGFLVGPPNAFHIYQFSTDEHRGRESRKKIPINVPLHGSMRRPKVVPGGCNFHVFHARLFALATTRLTPSLSIHDFVPRERLIPSMFLMGSSAEMLRTLELFPVRLAERT